MLEKSTVARLKMEIESPEFAVAMGGVLEENGVKKPGKNWVEFDSRQGRARFVIDIAPGGLGDTQAVNYIIEKVKPQKIVYHIGGGDDWGRTGSLLIPTSDERIFLKATTYLLDVKSSGYRDVQVGAVDDGYFELI